MARIGDEPSARAPLSVRARDQMIDVIRHWLGALEMGIPGGPPSWRVHPSQVQAAADDIVAALTSADPAMRHEGLISLIPWLGHHTMPVAESWWTSPLGLLATVAGDGDGWLTQAEGARALGVSVATVGRWLDAGRLTAGPKGPTGGRQVGRAEVARLILAREADGG